MGCDSCQKSEKPINCCNSGKSNALDWEFDPPSAGVIESIVINFGNAYGFITIKINMDMINS